MSQHESDLLSSALLDCHGAITHRFTLLADGRVRLRSGTVEILIDPTNRVVLAPRGAHVPDQVMTAAVTLAAELRPDLRP